MKSVEKYGDGRTFQESLQKALRSLETGSTVSIRSSRCRLTEEEQHRVREELRMPGPDRLRYVADALRAGFSFEEVHSLCRIDPWFLAQIEDLIREEQTLQTQGLEAFGRDQVRRLKRKGFSDRRLATLLGVDEASVRRRRHTMGIRPIYKLGTCAAEFSTSTGICIHYERSAKPAHDRKNIMYSGEVQ